MTTATIVELPRLLPWQREVAHDRTRFQVLANGRRSGKTMLAICIALKRAADGGRVWWVAPSYPMASAGWREIKRLAVQIPGISIKEAERIVNMPGAGWLQVRSADNPDSLRGEGLDLLVIDEAAFVAEEAWTEALRPTLSDRNGRALIISTPKGLNWFWRAWQRGNCEPEWRSWQLPTSCNPRISADEIEAARQQMPERTFMQEYLAHFISDEGQVFRRLLEAATLDPQPWQQGHQYVVGCDWGKLEDFSAFSVLDLTTKQQAYLDRSNRIDYTLQVGRLKALCERYHPAAIVAEANSMGQAIIEWVKAARLPVYSWTATQATKQAMVEQLALAFEQGQLKILRDPVQLAELQAFEATRTPSGLMRYAAPEGQHDDTVIALGLAWLAARPQQRGGSSRDFEVAA